MKDNSLIKTTAMPNASATATTGIITLPQQAVRPFTSEFRVRVYNTVATGVTDKTITYSLKGSNNSDGSSPTTIRSWTVTGVSSTHPASSREVYIDPNADKKYLFCTATGESGGGNASDGTFGLEVII